MAREEIENGKIIIMNRGLVWYKEISYEELFQEKIF